MFAFLLALYRLPLCESLSAAAMVQIAEQQKQIGEQQRQIGELEQQKREMASAHREEMLKVREEAGRALDDHTYIGHNYIGP